MDSVWNPEAGDTLDAAVAVVRTAEADPRYLIIQRAAHPDDPWSGHLAFPGGRREPGDTDLLTTARRETHEECGIDLFAVEGDPLAPTKAGSAVGRSVWVQPYLFVLPAPAVIIPCPREVARGFWVPASELCPHDSHEVAPMSRHMQDTLFPYIPIADARRGGFTYHLVMSDLTHPHHRPPDTPAPPHHTPRTG
jgi:8-oxo-dGTP pyrophosphatase MutT (NUDIX family)